MGRGDHRNGSDGSNVGRTDSLIGNGWSVYGTDKDPFRLYDQTIELEVEVAAATSGTPRSSEPMFGLSYGEIFLLLGATAALIGNLSLSRWSASLPALLFHGSSCWSCRVQLSESRICGAASCSLWHFIFARTKGLGFSHLNGIIKSPVARSLCTWFVPIASVRLKLEFGEMHWVASDTLDLAS